MTSLPVLTLLRRRPGRWLSAWPIGGALLAPFAAAQAHPGPHAGNSSALISHVLQSPDHQLTAGMLLAVAAVLLVSGIRLWRAQAGIDRRVLSGACLLAAGLIVWSVWHTGAALSS